MDFFKQKAIEFETQYGGAKIDMVRRYINFVFTGGEKNFQTPQVKERLTKSVELINAQIQQSCPTSELILLFGGEHNPYKLCTYMSPKPQLAPYELVVALLTWDPTFPDKKICMSSIEIKPYESDTTFEISSATKPSFGKLGLNSLLRGIVMVLIAKISPDAFLVSNPIHPVSAQALRHYKWSKVVEVDIMNDDEETEYGPEKQQDVLDRAADYLEQQVYEFDAEFEVTIFINAFQNQHVAESIVQKNIERLPESCASFLQRMEHEVESQRRREEARKKLGL